MELGFGSHRGRTSGCEERLAEELPRKVLAGIQLEVPRLGPPGCNYRVCGLERKGWSYTRLFVKMVGPWYQPWSIGCLLVVVVRTSNPDSYSSTRTLPLLEPSI
jgi:hypothetical protein